MENKNNNENELIKERRRKLSLLREHGNAFPNHFRRKNFAHELHLKHDASDKESLASAQIEVTVSGRMMVKRVMGKASFIKIQDVSGQIQIGWSAIVYPKGIIKILKNGMWVIF